MGYDAYKARFGPGEAREEYVSIRHVSLGVGSTRLIYNVAFPLPPLDRNLALVEQPGSSRRSISCKEAHPSQRVHWEARRHPQRSRAPWPQCLGPRLDDTGHGTPETRRMLP